MYENVPNMTLLISLCNSPRNVKHMPGYHTVTVLRRVYSTVLLITVNSTLPARVYHTMELTFSITMEDNNCVLYNCVVLW